jgi:hypothetical protein
VYVEPAKKSEKRAHIETVRGELLSGSLKVCSQGCQPLLDEWAALVWNEDKSAPDDRFEDHASDACLYLMRELCPVYRPLEASRDLSPAEQSKAETSAAKKAALKLVKGRLAKQMRRGQVMREIANPGRSYRS